MIRKDIKNDFPVFKNNEGIVYRDSSATTQKPRSVIDAVSKYYEYDNANPLRGLYSLSIRATDDYENAREAVRQFIGADSAREIIFTRNTSESLNLISYSYAENILKEGDEVLVSILEHHSNLLPWQRVTRKTGAKLRFVDCDVNGLITEDAFRSAVTERTKIVAMTHVSNVLGVKNDIKKFAAIAHDHGAVFVCDGAQSTPHMKIDVRDLDVDFFAFSGHKMLGPMGIGVLYAREEILSRMEPFLYGGEMIDCVTRLSATYAELPHKFEAGTVNAGGACGLKAAIDYYNDLGIENIEKREAELTEYAFAKLTAVPHLKLYGPETASEHHGIFSFSIDGVHPHDIATILDESNICIRAGHHCAQPLLKYMGVQSTARASIAFYNSEEDIDKLAAALSEVRGMMGYGE